MHRRRSAFLLAASLLALTACEGNDREVACNELGIASPPAGQPPAVCANFSATLTVRDRMGNAVTTIPRREAVTLEYQVTNHATSAQTLNVGSGCGEAFFFVDRVGEPTNCRLFYSPPSGTACPALAATTTYAAGETRTFTETWQQTDLDGAPVPSGRYLATAGDNSECYNLGRSAELRVR